MGIVSHPSVINRACSAHEGLMDAAAAFPLHQVASRADASAMTTARDTNRTLTVTATYLLSEAGRKASLLAGSDGRALQELQIQVPAHRLHLVSVDIDGVARLKLRPRYQVDGVGAVTRID